MKFLGFLNALGTTSVFTYETARVLLDQERATAQVTLSRWVAKGYLQRLRRELYVVGEEFRRTPVTNHLLACHLRSPAYLSSHWALQAHNLIPEAIWYPIAVTTKKPGIMETSFGRVEYQHIRPDLFWGFKTHETPAGQVFIAEPEKALLDLFWLSRRDWPKGQIEADLRLSGIEKFNGNKFLAYAKRFNSPRMERIAADAWALIQEAGKGWSGWTQHKPIAKQ